MPDDPRPRLIADLGGTYVRLALEVAPGRFEHQAALPCAAHADLHAAVGAYLESLPQPPHVQHAAVATANPVEGDLVRMTNGPWKFSIEDMRRRLGLQTLVVVNDFTALATAVPRLLPAQRRQVGGGQARSGSVIGVIGPGGGLGASGVIPAGEGFTALSTEGGHASFAPMDEREMDILRHALWRFEHVSFERLLSGPGLTLIHTALAERAGHAGDPLPPREITRRARAGEDARCLETVQAFCAMLGTAASNLAVTLGARGGIYLGGGIVPRLGPLFDASGFRARFESKGRFSAYVRAIPTFVITDEAATAQGVAILLAEHLRRRHTAGGTAILARVERLRASLSPAERRVADHVLRHPREALNDPIADIARDAGVSQPTVIRFCRSLGCKGLSEFKLRLASGLAGGTAVGHAQVTGEDSMLEAGVKVLGNTASAVLQLREALQRDAVDRAIDLLAGASRVDCFAHGQHRTVADDAQAKLLRLGVASATYTEPALQAQAAALMRPGEVALLLNAQEAEDSLQEVARAAAAAGASVVVVAPSASPLTRTADVALRVDHNEDGGTALPMVSRILLLVVVDLLLVGVAMRRGQPQAAAAGEPGAAAIGAEPAAAASPVPLAHLTAHGR